MRFPGNEGCVSCRPADLSREPPPPLPGGYAAGETVFWVGAASPDGLARRFYPRWRDTEVGTRACVLHAQAGEVVGPAPGRDAELAVRFGSDAASVGCALGGLSRARPPPLPGGYLVGEKVFFAGPRADHGAIPAEWRARENALRRELHGRAGVVIGPVAGPGQDCTGGPGSPAQDATHVTVDFGPVPGVVGDAEGAIGCHHEHLSRKRPPAAPGAPLADVASEASFISDAEIEAGLRPFLDPAHWEENKSLTIETIRHKLEKKLGVDLTSRKLLVGQMIARLSSEGARNAEGAQPRAERRKANRKKR